MISVFKRIWQEVIKLFIYINPRKLRKKIYAIPYLGGCLQHILRKILFAVLSTGDFQWFQFKYGPRAGIEMKLRLPVESEFFLETHDADITDLLCRYIRPGFTVVDAGAHIGYFTLLFSRLVGPKGKVFAIEPLPENTARLEEHILRNHCSRNTKVMRLALAEDDGQEQFLYFYFATIARFSSAESFVTDEPFGSIKVACRSLDSLLTDKVILPPDFIKIDVEGAELRALKGMENLLKTYQPKLLIEVHNEKDIGEIFKFLGNFSYQAYLGRQRINLSSLGDKTILLGASILFEAIV